MTSSTRHRGNTADPRNHGRHSDEATHDAADKPDSPTDLTKPSWFYIARKTAREFIADECTDLAAALTYYPVLARFPATIAILSPVGWVGLGRDTVDPLLQIPRDTGGGGPAKPVEPTRGALRAHPHT